MDDKQSCTLEIDGISVTVPTGASVLDAVGKAVGKAAGKAAASNAAGKIGISIPTLCYHEALAPGASCRLCIVEMSIEKRGKTYSWIDAACVYPAEEGLVVKTNTPKIRRERKLIIELLIARAPGSERINQLAEEYGAEKNRFVPPDDAAPECILCGLCSRVCNELIQVHGIATAFRGIRKKVVSPFHITDEVCEGCGACAFVCPTGAIRTRFKEKNLFIDAWNTKLEMTACISCGKMFSPAIQIGKLKAKIQLPDDILYKCPDCRRKFFAEGISR